MAEPQKSSLRKTYGLFIVVIDKTAQGKVLETQEMVVDYLNTNNLSLESGREHLTENFLSELKY